MSDAKGPTFDQMWAELQRTRKTLEVLIVWMAQSANSPISATEAGELLKRISGGK